MRPASSFPRLSGSAIILPAMEWTKSVSTESCSSVQITNSTLATTFSSESVSLRFFNQCFSRFHFPLPRFPELPMYPLHDTFRDSQRGIVSLHPCFIFLPLNHPRFVGENTPDCSFA